MQQEADKMVRKENLNNMQPGRFIGDDEDENLIPEDEEDNNNNNSDGEYNQASA